MNNELKKGWRVGLTEEGLKTFPRNPEFGTVVSFTRSNGLVTVLFEGRKRPVRIHQSWLYLIEIPISERTQP